MSVADVNQTVRSISIEEMPIILNLIANSIYENYEQIGTWTGEVDKKITWVHTGSLVEELLKNAADRKGDVPETLLQKAEDKVTFTVDGNHNFIYVDTLREKPSYYFNYNTGAEIGNSGSRPVYSTIIAKPDFLLMAEGQTFQKGTGRLIHKKVEKKISKQEPQGNLYKGGYDPRKVFFPLTEPTWDNINGIIQRITEFGKIEFDNYKFMMQECKKGDIVTYKLIEPSVRNLERSKPEHYLVLTMIFSSQYGFNMTSFEVADGSGTMLQKFTWEYESINNVYLPKRMMQTYYSHNGNIPKEKDYTYINNKINQEIPQETFGILNLHLKDGDIFIDEIENKRYKYKLSTNSLELISDK
jgi:hypothetical protein